MRAIVHIGAPKTGTSHLQASQKAGRRELIRREGVLYPLVGRQFEKRQFDRNVGLRFACEPFDKVANGLMEQAGLADPAKRRDYSAKFWDTLEEDIGQEGNIHTVVMADVSLFVFANKQMIEGVSNNLAKRFSNVTIVAFVRRPSDYLVSAYSQAIKMGARKRWNDYLSENVTNPKNTEIFKKKLMAWKKYSTYDDFVVQPLRGDILEQFSSATRLDLALPSASSGQNAALSAAGIQILRRINELCGASRNRPPRVRKAFERLATGTKWSPPSRDLKRIDKAFEAEMLDICEIFQLSIDDRKFISDFSIPKKSEDEQIPMTEDSVDELARIFLELARSHR